MSDSHYLLPPPLQRESTRVDRARLHNGHHDKGVEEFALVNHAVAILVVQELLHVREELLRAPIPRARCDEISGCEVSAAVGVEGVEQLPDLAGGGGLDGELAPWSKWWDKAVEIDRRIKAVG
jgi:hypothetical protein